MEEEGSGARFFIETRHDGAFVGWCAMFHWNPVYRSLGIGYCLDEPAWGKGYAVEAMRAVLHWAYATLDLNRVEAELDTRNAASMRVLEKLGFTRKACGGKTVSLPARFLIPGSTACSGANGRPDEVRVRKAGFSSYKEQGLVQAGGQAQGGTGVPRMRFSIPQSWR